MNNVQDDHRRGRRLPADEALPPPKSGPSNAQMHNVGVGHAADRGPTDNLSNVLYETHHARVFVSSHIYGQFIRQLIGPITNAAMIKAIEVTEQMEGYLFNVSFTESYKKLQNLYHRMAEVIRRRHEQVWAQQRASSSTSQGNQRGQVPMQNEPSNYQMWNSGAGAVVDPSDFGPGLSLLMGPEVINARHFIRDSIYIAGLRVEPQPLDDAGKLWLMGFAKRMEDGLFKVALEVKLEYMVLETMDTRFEPLVMHGLMPFPLRGTQAQPVNLQRRRVTAMNLSIDDDGLPIDDSDFLLYEDALLAYREALLSDDDDDDDDDDDEDDDDED
ncbi:hypothetical protein ACFE04_017570 [Oxalis oulophora]